MNGTGVTHVTQTVRNYKSMDETSFAVYVARRLSLHQTHPSAELFGLHDPAMRETFDNHTESVTRKVRSGEKRTWYNADIHSQRLNRRKLERRWQKTGLTKDRDLYLQQSLLVVHLIKDAKSMFYKDKLEAASP